ncbi:MAG: quinone oxidoreductase [Chloroflexota bacterium]|nr:quinone oxidoreductase [Chloroflexota bacterium]
MKAIQLTEVGGPEVLKFVEVPEPEPGPGQAIVQLSAAGVNYMDVQARIGASNPILPLIPGGEGSGIVIETGKGVTEVSIGDRVAYTGAGMSYAEKVCVPSWRLVKVPDGMDVEVGAAAMLQGMTAHYLAFTTYPLKTGDTALIHSGAGGVGLLLIQMAKMAGARVITTVSTKEKSVIAQDAGADHTILNSEQSVADEVMKITKDQGVQVVYDAVGKETFEGSVASLSSRGYLVSYGAASGPVPPVPLSVLNPKSLFLTRPTLVSYTATRKELEQRSADVLGWVKSGKLHVKIHGRYALKDAAEAHRDLQGRFTSGKLLLIP